MTDLADTGRGADTRGGADTGALWPPHAPSRAVLSARRFRTAAAFAAALLDSPEQPMAMPPWEVALKLDRYLDSLRTRLRWRALAALSVLEWWPLLSVSPPLSRMSVARRRRYLARHLPRHRGMFGKSAAIKSLLYLVYYGDARVNAVTGFVPVPDRVDARRDDVEAAARAPAPGRRTGS